MKKELSVLFSVFAVVFLISAAAFVIAENEQGNAGLTNGPGKGGNPFSDANNVSKNASAYGQCVVEAAQARQACFKDDKNMSKQCASAAKLVRDKKQAKTCLSDYKSSKKDCQESFKEARKTCIETYKPGFWARMRYAIKYNGF
jgi:hypothetical protein